MDLLRVGVWSSRDTYSLPGDASKGWCTVDVGDVSRINATALAPFLRLPLNIIAHEREN